MVELLIKNGSVIDPSQGIQGRRDIAILNGKITAIASDLSSTTAQRIIDAHGKLVTPGLIDIHTHIADGLIPIGASPDECGVFSGVTTVCDAGSLGWANFNGMKKYVLPYVRTDVFCFLNISSTGLAIMPEVWSWENIDPAATENAIKENLEIIRGVKVRATGSFIRNLGIDGIKVAKRVSTETRVPLMVHLGIEPGEDIPDVAISDFTKEMLSLLTKGDILSHIFTWKKGGIINADGQILSEAKEAAQRGVFLDVANAKTHFSIDIARGSLEQGFLPQTISTDLTNINMKDSVFSLPVTMSKFRAAGLSLEQVIKMTTINPATVLGEEHRRGSLREGFSADISIFDLKEGEFQFADGILGRSFQGNFLLVPWLTIKSGIEIAAKPRFLEKT